MISVRTLRKVDAVAEREAGLGAAVRSLVRRRTRSVEAVAGVSFQIRSGEAVGFLRPDGAGKTTTLKLLVGLLHPTSGEARVLGCTSHRREHRFLSRIALVMGTRTRLDGDLPVAASLEVHGVRYGAPENTYRRTRGDAVNLLDRSSPCPTLASSARRPAPC